MRQDAKTWHNPYSSRPPFVFGISPGPGPVQTSNFTCAKPNSNLRPKQLSSAVDSNVEPNLVELDCKNKRDTIANVGYC